MKINIHLITRYLLFSMSKLYLAPAGYSQRDSKFREPKRTSKNVCNNQVSRRLEITTS